MISRGEVGTGGGVRRGALGDAAQPGGARRVKLSTEEEVVVVVVVVVPEGEASGPSVRGGWHGCGRPCKRNIN